MFKTLLLIILTMLTMQCVYGNTLTKTTPVLIEYIQKYIQKNNKYSFCIRPILDEDAPYFTGFEFKINIKIGKE